MFRVIDLFSRLSLRFQFALLMTLLTGVSVAALVFVGQSIVVSQTVTESRTVADMTEHIGKWASKYGGVHIRRVGGEGGVGAYLQRSVYAASSTERSEGMCDGFRLSGVDDAKSLERVEAYHWKNPALVQREVSDIAAASTAAAKFRLTAKSVLNTNNAPNAFEREAIAALDVAFNMQAKDGAGAAKKPLEYWRVEGGQVLYARALIAQASCLKCHGNIDDAPAFLRANLLFNGGGGFGYEADRPAGIISVAIPLPDARQALAASMTPSGWAALGAVVLVGLGIMLFIGRVITPLNELRRYADQLASANLNDSFEVPAFAKLQGKSSNEVHRLGQSIAELGQSVKILYRKVREMRAEKGQQ